MEEKVFLNGKFVAGQEAKLSVLTPGFLYGWGLFETMRSYHKRIVYFDEHLERIKDSCGLIGIRFPYPLVKLKELIKKAVSINAAVDAYVRLALYKSAGGTGTLIVVKKYKPFSARKYKQGFRACICSLRQNENSYLSRLKTANYLLYKLAYAQAKEKRFDEAVILNNRGYICEGSRANVFFSNGREIFTPALECGCLGGITRRIIFTLAKKCRLKIYDGKFTLADLYQADEAFLTNSLMGVMPLVSLEKKLIGRGRPASATKFFMQEYNRLLRNGT